MFKKEKIILIVLGLIILIIPLFFIFPNVKASNETTEEGFTVSYIYVDIKGAISHPGVYRITSSTRLFQLVEIAGGLTTDAETKEINLAKRLSDEESYYIPFYFDEISEVGGTLININTASAVELDKLPGIGKAMGEAIVEYRKKIGPFKELTDIMNVVGIGESTYEKIKDYIRI